MPESTKTANPPSTPVNERESTEKSPTNPQHEAISEQYQAAGSHRPGYTPVTPDHWTHDVKKRIGYNEVFVGPAVGAWAGMNKYYNSQLTAGDGEDQKPGTHYKELLASGDLKGANFVQKATYHVDKFSQTKLGNLFLGDHHYESSAYGTAGTNYLDRALPFVAMGMTRRLINNGFEFIHEARDPQSKAVWKRDTSSEQIPALAGHALRGTVRWVVRTGMEDLFADSRPYLEAREKFGHFMEGRLFKKFKTPVLDDDYHKAANRRDGEKPISLPAWVADIGIGFTVYNIMSKMWRDGYDKAESLVAQGWNKLTGKSKPDPDAPHVSLFQKVKTGSWNLTKYMACLPLRVAIYMVPATLTFSVPRYFQQINPDNPIGHKTDAVAAKLGEKVNGLLNLGENETFLGMDTEGINDLTKRFARAQGYNTYIHGKGEAMRALDDRLMQPVAERLYWSVFHGDIGAFKTAVKAVGAIAKHDYTRAQNLLDLPVTAVEESPINDADFQTVPAKSRMDKQVDAILADNNVEQEKSTKPRKVSLKNLSTVAKNNGGWATGEQARRDTVTMPTSQTVH